jgi:hypothetical protein
MTKKLNEDLNKLKQEPSEKASAHAKKLGLNYVGFGRYEDGKTNQVTHIVQNDKLVPFKRAVKSSTFRDQNADDLGTYSTLKLPETQALHIRQTDTMTGNWTLYTRLQTLDTLTLTTDWQHCHWTYLLIRWNLLLQTIEWLTLFNR